MNAAYYILLFSTLILPLVGLFASRTAYIPIVSRISKPVLLFLLLHNVYFFFGYSMKGDLIDYYVFSSEYLIFCIVIFRLAMSRRLYMKVLGALGATLIAIIFLIGLPGTLLFIVVSQDFVP